MSAFLRALSNNKSNEEELGGQMSFLEHLDELRRRLIRSFIFVFLAASIAFFFAELIVAPIWAVPMDIAPRYAGSASGMMNFGSAFAGIVSPLVFGYLIDLTGGWTVPFLAVVALLFLGAFSAFYLRPDVPFAEGHSPRAEAVLKPAE
jgi:MFS family permease